MKDDDKQLKLEHTKATHKTAAQKRTHLRIMIMIIDVYNKLSELRRQNNEDVTFAGDILFVGTKEDSKKKMSPNTTTLLCRVGFGQSAHFNDELPRSMSTSIVSIFCIHTSGI